jgi:hypothetical protein
MGGDWLLYAHGQAQSRADKQGASKMYKTQQQADRTRAIWQEALNTTESDEARVMAWDAGDNAAETCAENGQARLNEKGCLSDEFLYWWELSLISILSDSRDTSAHAYFAKRGITA